MRRKYSSIVLLSLGVLSCGGSQPPAEEPEAKSATEAPKVEAPAEPPAAAVSTETRAKPKPKEILTAPDVVFMFSMNGSDLLKQAEERCDEKSGGDAKKRAECLSKERDEVEAHGFQFLKEGDRWYWLTVQRKRGKLTVLHKLPIEFVDQRRESIGVKPIGKDEGTLRGRGAPGETTIEIPNEYQIVVTDPKRGKMVYEAKLGLIGEQAR